MTGFAQVRRTTALGELTLSLRSVNHRGLDLHFHMAPDFGIFENAIRAAIKRELNRGHIEIRLSLAFPDESTTRNYNAALVETYISAFRQAAAAHNLDQQRPDLNVIFARPGIFDGATNSQKPVDASFEPEVLAALDECLLALNQQREREGAALRSEFVAQASGVEAAASEILAIRETALPQFQQRLRDRLTELLGPREIPESRLVEEAALLTDRSDIQEELTRLSIHSTELRRMLDSGGEVGKKLDFLLQEMNRETNTVLSKTSGLGETGLTVTARALAIKAHIEKIREQALNIE